MSQPVLEPVLKTPAEWLALTEPGIQIMDPDGWRRDNTPFDTPLTLEDFQSRLAQSTIMGRPQSGGNSPTFAPERLPQPAILNLNWNVRLRLTPAGVIIVSRANRERHRADEQTAGRPQNYSPCYKVSGDGYLTVALWEAFHLFGGDNMPGVATFHGVPFETEVEIIPT